MTSNVQVGETKHGRDIGYANDRTIYISTECKNCGKIRWVQKVKNAPKYDLCGACAQKIAALKRCQENHPRWRGGRKLNRHNGYIRIRIYESTFQSMADCDGYILEHRLIMAQYLGRCLHRYEEVHHKNGIRDDNRIENLEIYNSGDHIKEHSKGYRAGFEQGFKDGKDAEIQQLKCQIDMLNQTIQELSRRD